MKDFTIDWRVGGSYSVEATTEEEATKYFFENFEFIMKDALGRKLQGVEIEDIYKEDE